MSKPKTFSKTARRSRRRLQQLVGLLEKAAETHEDLAKSYREMEWDVSADRAEEDAAEFRRRAESFRTEMKQPNK